MTFYQFDINLNELSCCIDRSCSSVQTMWAYLILNLSLFRNDDKPCCILIWSYDVLFTRCTKWKFVQKLLLAVVVLSAKLNFYLQKKTVTLVSGSEAMKERQKQAKALKESRKLEVNLSVNKQTVIHETAMHAFFITVESRAELLYQEKKLHGPKVGLKSCYETKNCYS